VQGFSKVKTTKLITVLILIYKINKVQEARRTSTKQESTPCSCTKSRIAWNKR